MPFLKKVVNGARERASVPPRSLAASVSATLTAFSRSTVRPESDDVAKIEVHDTISNVAWAYEKLRQAIDYQDEHLLRKNAIERIIKRRLVAGATAETIAEPLVLELIRGRYLPNNSLPVTIIAEVGEIINSYIHLWTNVPTAAARQETDKLFNWCLGLMAVQLNEALVPTDHDEALLKLMFETTHRDITFAEDHITEPEKNTQLYIAIHRALLKSDTNIIRYHLFIRQRPEWRRPTPEVIAELGRLLPSIRTTIDGQLLHPAGELLQRLMKKYAIAFLIFDDLAKEYGEKALQLASQADRQFALRTLGVVHLARKEPETAIERLDAALRERQHLRPGDIEFTRYHLARAYLDLGREREAKGQLQLIESGRTLYAEKARALMREIAPSAAA